MAITIHSLAQVIKDARTERQISQQALADKLGTEVSRNSIARLEQGKRIPNPEALRLLAEYLNVPKRFWEPFLNEAVRLRIDFEDSLSEMTGQKVSLEQLDDEAAEAAENLISFLFNNVLTPQQTFDTVNRCLVFYHVPMMS